MWQSPHGHICCDAATLVICCDAATLVICCDAVTLVICYDAVTLVKLVVTSNGYVTCGIARLQVVAMCCESTHVRGVSCNVSGIWNVVET